jgi:hypothetical protein
MAYADEGWGQAAAEVQGHIFAHQAADKAW